MEDLAFISKLIEKGKLKPVLDAVYPLRKAGEAFRYYSEGHSRGKVIISVST
jgi:NADPH:quinone reductase-like Zn-dependent oxidoreductase